MSLMFCRSAKEGPTIHAFAHSLSTIVDYVRDRLVEYPPSDPDLETGSGRFGLSNLWSRYQLYEELLVALGDLYGRVSSITLPIFLSQSNIPPRGNHSIHMNTPTSILHQHSSFPESMSTFRFTLTAFLHY